MSPLLAYQYRQCIPILSIAILQTNYQNPTIHLSHIPQYGIQNRGVYITVVYGALWEVGQVHCGICEIGLLGCFTDTGVTVCLSYDHLNYSGLTLEDMVQINQC